MNKSFAGKIATVVTPIIEQWTSESEILAEPFVVTSFQTTIVVGGNTNNPIALVNTDYKRDGAYD